MNYHKQSGFLTSKKYFQDDYMEVVDEIGVNLNIENPNQVKLTLKPNKVRSTQLQQLTIP